MLCNLLVWCCEFVINNARNEKEKVYFVCINTMKVTVIIIQAHHCYQQHAKFYQEFFCQDQFLK